MTKRIMLLVMLLAAASCNKPEPESSSSDSSALLNLETKALGPGDHTYRVAISQPETNYLLAQGSYCSKTIDHTSTLGEDGIWLSPCKVNSAGVPLKADNTEAGSFDEAATSGVYGLRYDKNVYCYLTVASPARSLSSDGQLRYYSWLPNQELYVSGSQLTVWYGTWLGSQYVYKAKDNPSLALKDRRARLKVRIECGQLTEAYIQKVSIINRVKSACYYVPQGFSADPAHYITETVDLYDCGSGAPMHLVREDSDFWLSSTELMIPSLDYSDMDYAGMRPAIQVLMGDDTDHPAQAVVFITENVDPMKNYTYTLYVSKSYAIVTLTTSDWEDGGTHSTTTSEPVTTLGTITVDGWTPTTDTADPWNTL